MEIKLQSLELSNFKGIEHFKLSANGKNCSIVGKNGTGKTTIYDAFLWIFYNKDSEWKSDFAVKTLAPDGEEKHNLEHTVECVLDIDSKEKKFKKTLKEIWRKKRGTRKATFTGNTTDYFIDDVPVQKKEWANITGDIIEEETFRLLTSPDYFNNLHWEKRRNILIGICGDVDQKKIIASDQELSALSDILGDKTIEDHRKIVKAQQKLINDKLKEIPARIDELHNTMKDTSEYDVDKIKETISYIEIEIKALKENTKETELRTQKTNLRKELAEVEETLSNVRRKAANNVINAIEQQEREYSKSLNEKGNLANDIKEIRIRITGNNEVIDKLRKEFNGIVEEKYSDEKVCPSCGQDLPEDQIEKAREKHNKAQAERLNKINERGSKLVEENERLQSKMTKLQDKLTGLEKYIVDVEKQIEDLKEEKEDAYFNAGENEKKEVEKIKASIEGVEEEIEILPNIDTSELEEELKVERTKLVEIDVNKKNKKRAKELAEEEKRLAGEYEELEKQMFLMERFEKVNAEMLEEKINSRFQMVKWKMFEQQINEGIKPTCIATIEGVPWPSLNTGARIMGGLDIVTTLQDFYGINAPCWLDHMEALSSDPSEMNCQMIMLKVAGNGKLSVEYK